MSATILTMPVATARTPLRLQGCPSAQGFNALVVSTFAPVLAGPALRGLGGTTHTRPVLRF